jgi:hypothetical protein
MKINGKTFVVYLILSLILSSDIIISTDKILTVRVSKKNKRVQKVAKSSHRNSNKNSNKNKVSTKASTKTKRRGDWDPVANMTNAMKTKIQTKLGISEAQMVAGSKTFEYMKGFFFFILNIVNKIPIENQQYKNILYYVNQVLRIGGICKACYEKLLAFYNSVFNTEQEKPQISGERIEEPDSANWLDFHTVNKYFDGSDLYKTEHMQAKPHPQYVTNTCKKLIAIKNERMKKWDESKVFIRKSGKHSGEEMNTYQIMKKIARKMFWEDLGSHYGEELKDRLQNPIKDKNGQNKKKKKMEWKDGVLEFTHEKALAKICVEKSDKHYIYRGICMNILVNELSAEIIKRIIYQNICFSENNILGEFFRCSYQGADNRLKKRLRRNRKPRVYFLLGAALIIGAGFNYMFYAPPEDKLAILSKKIESSMKNKQNSQIFFKTFNLSEISIRHIAIMQFLDSGCVKSILLTEQQIKKDRYLAEQQKEKSAATKFFEAIQKFMNKVFETTAQFSEFFNSCIAPANDVYNEYQDMIKKQLQEKQKVEYDKALLTLKAGVNEIEVMKNLKILGISEEDVENTITDVSLDELFAEGTTEDKAGLTGEEALPEKLLDDDVKPEIGEPVDGLEDNNYGDFSDPDWMDIPMMSGHQDNEKIKIELDKAWHASKKLAINTYNEEKKKINDECAKGYYSCGKLITKKSAELAVGTALTASNFTVLGLARRAVWEGGKMVGRQVILKNLVFKATDPIVTDYTTIETDEKAYKSYAKKAIRGAYLVGKLVLENDIKKPKGGEFLKKLKALGSEIRRDLNAIKGGTTEVLKSKGGVKGFKKVFKNDYLNIKHYTTDILRIPQIKSNMKIVKENAKNLGFEILTLQVELLKKNGNIGKVIKDRLKVSKEYFKTTGTDLINHTKDVLDKMRELSNKEGIVNLKEYESLHYSVNEAYANLKKMIEIADDFDKAINKPHELTFELIKDEVRDYLLKDTSEEFKRQVKELEKIKDEVQKSYAKENQSLKVLEAEAKLKAQDAEIIKKVDDEWLAEKYKIEEEVNVQNEVRDIPDPAQGTPAVEIDTSSGDFKKYQKMLSGVLKQKFLRDSTKYLEELFYVKVEDYFTLKTNTILQQIKAYKNKVFSIAEMVSYIYPEIKKQICKSIIESASSFVLLKFINITLQWKKYFNLISLVYDFSQAYKNGGIVDQFSIAGEIIGVIIELFLGPSENPVTNQICAAAINEAESAQGQRKLRNHNKQTRTRRSRRGVLKLLRKNK